MISLLLCSSFFDSSLLVPFFKDDFFVSCFLGEFLSQILFNTYLATIPARIERDQGKTELKFDRSLSITTGKGITELPFKRILFLRKDYRRWIY